MKRFLAAPLLAALLSAAPARVLAAAPACSYALSSGSVHVAWQAYKTTKKVAVHGEFKKLEVSAPSTGTSLDKMLKSSRITLDVLSSDSANPERDANLSKFFFSLFSSPKAEGRVSSVKGGDSGTFDLALNLNGRKRKIPMTYELTAQGDFTATGHFDMLDFGLNKAYDSIHAACIERHKGDDGVSKTWSDVDLKITAKVDKTCS